MSALYKVSVGGTWETVVEATATSIEEAEALGMQGALEPIENGADDVQVFHTSAWLPSPPNSTIGKSS